VPVRHGAARPRSPLRSRADQAGSASDRAA
jgi:hypothetical protein